MGIEAVQSRIVLIEATIGSLSVRPAWSSGAAAGSAAGSTAAGAGLSTAAGTPGSWAGPGSAAGGVLGGAGGPGGFSAALDQALDQASGRSSGPGPVQPGSLNQPGSLGQAGGAVAGTNATPATPSTPAVTAVPAAPINPSVPSTSATPGTGASGSGGGAGVGTSRTDATRGAGGAGATAGTGSATGSGSAAGSAFGDRIVESASKHLGVRYVWGGNSPSQGFDCSGLVKYVLRELGVSMPRVARDQAKMGTEVASLAQARPGDLLGMRNGTHIAIYLGDNKILHAPQPGERVSIRSLHSGDDIDTIRRVAPAGGSATAASAGASTRAAFEQLVGAGA